jgi:hypothetical protein
MQLDERWAWPGMNLSKDYLREQARWLREERGLHQSSLDFFRLSGALLDLAVTDYPFASVAFFHAIPGLERQLRRTYSDEASKFTEMLQRAVAERRVREEHFSARREFTPIFAKGVERLLGKVRLGYPELFAQLVPKLRNEYFHGNYLLAPDYLPLTLQLRSCADALNASGQK